MYGHYIIGLVTFLVTVATFSSELDPDSILSKLECSKSTVVTILGETHGSLSSKQVGDHTMSLANEKFVYYSNEVIRIGNRSWAGDVFGIEEPIPYAASLMFLSEKVLDAVQNESYEHLTSETFLLVASKSMRSLMTVVGLEEVRQLFDNSLPIRLLVEANKNASRGAKQEIITQDLLSKMSLKDWYFFANSVSKILAKKLIETYPKLLSEGNVTSIFGSGRNILFTKNIMAKYCEAAKAGKPMFIQMGQGHSEQVALLLKIYLPPTATIKIFTTDEIAASYVGFRERFENGGFLKEYKALMKQDPENVNYSFLMTPSLNIWPKQKFVSPSQVKALKVLAKKWGLEIAYNGSIDVFELPK